MYCLCNQSTQLCSACIEEITITKDLFCLVNNKSLAFFSDDYQLRTGGARHYDPFNLGLFFLTDMEEVIGLEFFFFL